MNKCPICGKEVEEYHEVTFTEPYTHNIPFDGLHIYGAYSAPKETICFENNFLHFAFYDMNNELINHKLVKLGVENPTTPTPSQEYIQAKEMDDQTDDYLSDWEEDDYEDNPIDEFDPFELDENGW